MPLSFELGEAFQFDWSEEGLVVGSICYRIQVSHLKLCGRHAFWLIAYTAGVVVISDDAVVARHERLSDSGGVRYDWHHHIPLIQRKPGALRNGAPFLPWIKRTMQGSRY